MTALDQIAANKLVQMKALLGDEASKKILEAAEAREQQATAAGLEFKEKKTTTKDDSATETTEDETTEDGPLTLSQLLQELEQGLESGDIVDDVTTDDNGETPADAKEADEAFKVALKEAVAEVFDEKFGKFLTALTMKEAAADPKVAALTTKLKEAEAAQTKIKEQLDELLGVQPKAKPFRASQEAATVVAAKDAANLDQPHADPVNAFISEFLLNNGQKA